MSASTRTAIVADTTSYLPPELLERHDVHLISLYVGLEGEQEREGEISDLPAFSRGCAPGRSVTNSQPSWAIPRVMSAAPTDARCLDPRAEGTGT